MQLGLGAGYHRVGVLRSKPGRGDPSLSQSCSDKVMRWNALGVQGALLAARLAEPLYLHSVTVGQLFHREALQRALVGRLDTVQLGPQLSPPFRVQRPALHHSGRVAFHCERSDVRSLPCSFGTRWFACVRLGVSLCAKGNGRCVGETLTDLILMGALAINWWEGADVAESLAGAAGIKQGSTTKTPPAKRRSRLCRRETLERLRSHPAFTYALLAE